jgi:hypothetical protein
MCALALHLFGAAATHHMMQLDYECICMRAREMTMMMMLLIAAAHLARSP